MPGMPRTVTPRREIGEVVFRLAPQAVLTAKQWTRTTTHSRAPTSRRSAKPISATANNSPRALPPR